MKRPEGPGTLAPPEVVEPKRAARARKSASVTTPPKATTTTTAKPATAPASKPKPASAIDPTAQARKAEKDAQRDAAAAAAARRRFEHAEARRFTRHSRARRRVWISFSLGIVLLVGLVLVGMYSPLFAVNTVTVTGTTRVDAAAVTKVLDGHLGTPLPQIDQDQVKKELAAFPLIASFSLERELPGTLIVRIVERAPIALIRVASGYQLVDPAGIVVEEAADRPAGYPVMTVSDVSSTNAGFRSAVQVLLSMPADLAAQVDTITAQTQDDVTLTLTTGQRVIWGSAEDSGLKAVGLGRLIATQAPGAAVEYDVSSPSSLVVRHL